MKKIVSLALLAITLLLCVNCGAIFSEHKYGVSSKGVTIGGVGEIKDILMQFGAPSFVHETSKYDYYVFDGRYSRTILGLITNVETQALVIEADKSGKVLSTHTVPTGNGQTIFGWPGLFVENVIE